MVKPRIVLCPPIHFQIRYTINPWMDTSRPVNQAVADNQYQQLKQLYQQLGADVWEIAPDPELPDMVFTANYGIVVGQTFIPARFRHAERQAEAARAAEYLQNQGFTSKELTIDVVFEG